MEKELSLKEIISGAILFFINSRKIIIAVTVFGTLSAILFQKLRPAYYNTQAIATSGIADFERLESKEVLSQRVAVDIINLLSLDIRKEDYGILAKKMNISLETASAIRSIKAEEIMSDGEEEQRSSTSKFSIELSVSDNSYINSIQDGLVYYFTTNQYIKDYYEQFFLTTSNEINAIDHEVGSLRAIRNSEKSAIDISSINLNSKRDPYDINNQILGLVNLKSKHITDLALLRPLSFVTSFSLTENPERQVLILGGIAAVFSFLLSILIALFNNVYVKSKE